jgi:hypothetical protein
MSLASKVKNVDVKTLAPVMFYATVGIIFLAMLPLSNFPPHIALTAILSLITAYGILKKTFWTLWLVIALFTVATTISLYTLYIIGFANWVVSTGMIIYMVLTWLVTLYIVLKRKLTET